MLVLFVIISDVAISKSKIKSCKHATKMVDIHLFLRKYCSVMAAIIF